jgi:predicted  nucleic acid-binding Zn-ribbon protein
MARGSGDNLAVKLVLQAQDLASKVVAKAEAQMQNFGDTSEAVAQQIAEQFDALTKEAEKFAEQIKGLEGKRIRLELNQQDIQGKIAQVDADLKSLSDQKIKLEAEGGSAEEIAKLQRKIEALSRTKIRLGLDAGDVEAQIKGIDDQIAGLNESIADVQGSFQKVEDGIREANKPVSGFKKSFDQISEVSSKVAFIGLAFQQVQGVINIATASVSGFYNAFVQSNVQLQEQLLATQSSLVATNEVLIAGVKVEDPTQAIQALEKPVSEAIEGLRRDSLELVGVTSAELIPIFQLLAQEGANIGASLTDAKDLTVDFAASLGTLGIPLFQAREEVQSILTGQISSDSQLAKSIGLNNEQVKLWKEQGVLVERLRERLEAFRAGNALAAQTINGVTSNIQEIFQEVTRIAGAPLLDPIVEQLTRFYKFLEENRDTIEQILTRAITILNQVADEVIGVVDSLLPAVAKLAGEIGKALGGAAEGGAAALMSLLEVAAALLSALAPLISLVAELVGLFADFASSGVGKAVIEIGALLVVANLLIPALTGIAAQGAIAALKFGLMAASSIAASGGVAGFAVALKGLAVSAAAAAAPITALAAGVGVLAVAIQTDRLQDVNDAIDSYGSSVGMLGDEAIATAQKLKNLNDIEKNGGKLTEEQARQRELLINLAGQQGDSLSSLKTEIEALQPANEAQRQAQQALIANLEASERALNSATGGVQLQGNALQNLARSIQQVNTELSRNQLVVDLDQSQQLAVLQGQLNDGLVSQSEFNQESERINQESLDKRLADTTEKVAKLKKEYDELSEADKEQAGESLAEIQKLEKQQADLERQSAEGRFKTRQEALERAQQRATDTIKSSTQTRENELASLRQQGLISEREYQERILDSSLERIDAEIAAEEQKLKDILATQGDGSEARASQQRLLELRGERIDNERQQDVQAEGDRQKREEDALRRSNSLQEIALKQRRATGELTEREFQEALTELNAGRIDQELANEQAKLGRLKAIYGEDSDEVKASQQRILDLTSERIESEITLQQQAQEKILRAIDRRAKAAENAATRETQDLESVLRLYDSLNSSLEQQSKLLQAQADLRRAENDLAASNFDIAASLTKNERTRQRIQAQGAIEQLEALQEQQAFEDQSLLIQQELERLALKRRQTEADIAEIQAKAALAQAEAEQARVAAAVERGEANEQDLEAANLAIRAAQFGIEAAQQQKAITAEEAALLPQTQAIARRQQDVNQQGQLNQARATVIQALPENSRIRRDASDERISQLLTPDQRQLARSTRGTNDALLASLEAAPTSTLGVTPVLAPAPDLAPLQGVQEAGNQYLETIAANTARRDAPGITVNVSVNGAATNDQTGATVAATVRAELERLLDRAGALQTA